MIKHIRNRYFLICDLVFFSLAAYLSFAIRLDNFDITPYNTTCVVLIVLAVAIMPVVFTLTGIYSRYWPYAYIKDLVNLLVATLLGVLLVSLVMWVIEIGFHPSFKPLPISIPLIYSLTALIFVSIPRVAVRLMTEAQHRHQFKGNSTIRVLIMGAGQSGKQIAQELDHNSQLGIALVGFIDDNRNKHGMRINGIPVLGDRHAIPDLVRKYQVTRVIIAMPKAPGKVIREIVNICTQAGVQTKTMPGIYEILGGQVSVNHLRDVQIEDLLRRDSVQTDQNAIANLIKGKRVMITGGGGSIGSELCRQVLRHQPTHLVILGHGENSVFEIQTELQRHMEATGQPPPSTIITAVVADIRLEHRLQAVFTQHRPQIVFHTAAHKHVPLMELNPTEAVTNNVLGTRNLLHVCTQTGVEHVVMVSSDKAVNPTSIMGASKRMAEFLVLHTARKTKHPYVTVRFGNVLGSRGSVALTFKRQITTGGPITITHPEMQRYFMTIPEAVQLVLQAAVLGQGGEVFCLDMGEPIKLVDLARDMIRLSGLEPERDIDIVYTGIRPGEKLFEELFNEGESYEPTSHPKILIAKNASTFVPEKLDEIIQRFESAVEHDDAILTRRLFQQVIPEYKPSEFDPTLPNLVSQPIAAQERSAGGASSPMVQAGK